MRAFLCDGLRNSFEPLGVRGDVFQFCDTEFEKHVADTGIGAAQRGQDQRQRFAGLLTATTCIRNERTFFSLLHCVAWIWASLTWLNFRIVLMVLSSNWFSLLPQLPQKMMLDSKLVKSNSKIIILLRESKSVTHLVDQLIISYSISVILASYDKIFWT